MASSGWGVVEGASSLARSLSTAYDISVFRLTPLAGGVGECPLLVEGGTKEYPIFHGVLKAMNQAEVERQNILSIILLSQSGFLQMARPIPTSVGAWTHGFEGKTYYFSEYLAPDPSSSPPAWNQIVRMLALFHTRARSIGPLTPHVTKMQEFLPRISQLEKSGWPDVGLGFFEGARGERLLRAIRYFSSQDFGKKYHLLPRQVIHGDAHIGNTIVKGGVCHLLDWDSLKEDTRLIDFATYFRNGYFEKAVDILSSSEAFQAMLQEYEREGLAFTPEEKNLFPQIILFSQVEGMVWCLLEWKNAMEQKNEPRMKMFQDWLMGGRDSVEKLLVYIPLL